MSAARPILSIVTPAYNEAESLPALHERLCAVLGPGADWELIVIDDGSSDDSFSVLRELNGRDPRVRSVHLLLNSGHMKALVAGIDHADGDLVITMDADLQHPPEVIPEIVSRWKAGALVVHTIRQETRHEGFLKKLSSRAYYDLFRRLTGIPIRPGMADFRGIDRRVVLMLRDYREDTIPIRFLLAKLPFPSAEILYQPGQRFAGETKYTVSKMLAFAADSLFSFSLAPLYFGHVIGGLFLAFFVLYDSALAAHGWGSRLEVGIL